MPPRIGPVLNLNCRQDVSLNPDVDEGKLGIPKFDCLRSVLETLVHGSVSEDEVCCLQLAIRVYIDWRS